MSDTSETRLAEAIEQLTNAITAVQSTLQPTPAITDTDAIAYRWQRRPGLFSTPMLMPVAAPQLITPEALKNIDRQKQRVFDNTHQFVLGLPANNVLMTGARGTGKSSLVRSCLAQFHAQGLRLIEVEKHHLNDLPLIIDLVRHQPYKYIVFCDDLSFDAGETQYKGLKTVLDGSVAGPTPNVLIYATSNRKHMVSEQMRDNLETAPADAYGEIHPGDTVEEKISLSERFGLHLNFYSFSQPQYLDAVIYWLNQHQLHYAELPDNIKKLAIQWATQRGSRSGRVANQFARHYAGQQQLNQRLQHDS